MRGRMGGMSVQSNIARLVMNQEQWQTAWERMEALGGHGVGEADLVVVSLENTGISDDDLALFADLPNVQILDLSNNPLTDNCLIHLKGFQSLESLIIIGTNISKAAVEEFRTSHPDVEIRTTPLPKDTINPFTGKPFNADES